MYVQYILVYKLSVVYKPLMRWVNALATSRMIILAVEGTLV